jgi:Fic family protein
MPDRRTDIRRDSRPASPALFKDPGEKKALESRNGLRQYDEVVRLAEEAIKAHARFPLRPSTLQSLQRFAIEGIYTCAGSLRTDPVYIHGTSHEPPPAADVPALLEQLCDYVNDHWADRSAIHLSSFVMWRLNWVHPFKGGNGRTSRAASYLVLCVRAGQLFPGALTIPDQIVAKRDPYYIALDAADAAWAKGMVDVSGMEVLLEAMLARQLMSAHEAAKKV